MTGAKEVTRLHLAERGSRRNQVSGSWFRRDMAMRQGALRRLGDHRRRTASSCSPCRFPWRGQIRLARAWRPPRWRWRRRSGTARPQRRRARLPHLRAPPLRPPSRARRPSGSEGGRRHRGTSPPTVRGRSSCATASCGGPTPYPHRLHRETRHSELGSWVSRNQGFRESLEECHHLLRCSASPDLLLFRTSATPIASSIQFFAGLTGGAGVGADEIAANPPTQLNVHRAARTRAGTQRRWGVHRATGAVTCEFRDRSNLHRMGEAA